MSRLYYILEGKELKPVDDFLEWARWFETANRRVAETILPDNVCVSTVFLGIDHSFGGAVPLLFETMIFGGEYDEYQERYPTWKAAKAGHRKAVKMAKHLLKKESK